MGFNLKRDWRLVDWKATITLQALRAFIAGVIWAIIFAVAGNSQMALPALVGTLFFYLGGVWFYLIGIRIVASIVDAVSGDSFGQIIYGLSTLLFCFGIVVADPVLFFLRKSNPMIVPLEKFGFVNMTVIIFVVDEDRAAIR